MKAILTTWDMRKGLMEHARRVEIHDDHNFLCGPYQDTVPFSVGSNQDVIPDCSPDRGGMLWKALCRYAREFDLEGCPEFDGLWLEALDASNEPGEVDGYLDKKLDPDVLC